MKPSKGRRSGGPFGLRAIQLYPPYPCRALAANDESVVRVNGAYVRPVDRTHPAYRTIGIDDDRRPVTVFHREEVKIQRTARHATLYEYRKIVDAIRIRVCGGG